MGREQTNGQKQITDRRPPHTKAIALKYFK